MTKNPAPVIIIVRWEDPATYTTWIPRAKAEGLPPGDVLSVGILVSEDEKYLRITLDSMDGGEELNGVAVVPKRAITKIRRLKVPPGMLK